MLCGIFVCIAHSDIVLGSVYVNAMFRSSTVCLNFFLVMRVCAGQQFCKNYLLSPEKLIKTTTKRYKEAVW